MQITAFVPLAGRFNCWPTLIDALTKQTWDHSDIKLLLYDTSQSINFEQVVTKWIARCNYRVLYLKDNNSKPGLADLPRTPKVAHDVYSYLAKTYNAIVPKIDTPYIWFIDDDTIPPYNALELLFQGFDVDPAVFCVTGAYRLAKERHASTAYCAWMNPRHGFLPEGKGIQLIGGSGFGCALAKHFHDFNFNYNSHFPGGFDEQFFLREAAKGRKLAMHWGVKCDHISAHDKPHKIKIY